MKQPTIILFSLLTVFHLATGSAFGQAASGAMRDAMEQLKRGERAMDANDLAEAKRRFQRAVELDNSLVPAWEKLASIHYTEGQFPRAISVGEDGLKSNPGAAEIQLWLGLSYQMNNQVKEGTAALEAATAKNPSLFLAYYEPLRKIGLGIYYQKTGDNVRALAAFRNFLKFRPKEISKDVDHLVWFRVGEMELRLNRPAEALTACDESLKANAQYASATWCKGESLRQLGRYSEALPFFMRVVQHGPQRPRLLIGLAVSQLHSGNREGAVSTMRRYLNLRPTDPEGHLTMGDILFFIGRQEDAIRSYQRALQLDPAELVHHLKTGVAQIQVNQVEQAVETLEKALEKWPGDNRIRIPLAFALVQNRKAKEGYDLLAANQDTENVSYMSILGFAALRSGQIEKAYEILKKVVEVRPDQEQDLDNLVTAILGISHQAFDAGEPARAGELLKEASRLRPKDVRVLRNLAIFHLTGKNADEAMKVLNRALELAPTDFYLIRLKGRAYLAAGKLPEAVSHLTDARNRARRLATGVQARVEMDLGTALALSDDLERAVTMFESALSNSLTEPRLAALIEMNLVRALIARAANRLAEGKGREAEQDLDAVATYKRIQLDREEERQMQFLKAIAALEQEKYREAETMIAALAKKGPIANLFQAPYDTFGPDLLRAYIAYRQNRLDVARRDFRAVIEKAPSEIKNQVYAFLRSCDALDGTAQLRRNNFKAALNYFNLIPRGTLDPQSTLNFGLALYQSGQQAEGISVWQQLNTPIAACNLGAHYHNTGDAVNSHRYYKICVGAGLGGPEARTRMEFKQKLFNLQ